MANQELINKIKAANLVKLEEQVITIGNAARPNTPEWRKYEELNKQVDTIYRALRAEFKMTDDDLADFLDEHFGDE